ncbi:LPS-assembly protein LptD [Desulfospira joergensenii]|uniref:LPS-assembly protein LptD n=1 Tax=Desulfospira joergensenii TaxID=53329 RepID=UPI00129472B1|nr:LPS assembly protein LptD [Desulfospira joergensenii]
MPRSFSDIKMLPAAAFIFFALVLPELFFPFNPARAFSQEEDPKQIPWHISAQVVSYDQKKELYIAEDEVVITGGLTRLEADYVEFSNKTKDAFAQGNVVLISGEDSISCNAMQINLLTEQGFINKGTIFIQKNNFYIEGEKIRKTGKFTYSAEKGTITSCEGDSPAWKISGKNVKVTIEGYGYATHAAFWIKKVPALYVPFLAFPAKTKRQTGLLAPSFSSSDRLGFEYEQPLFIALSRDTDATLYADYMSDRGLKLGGEFRYVLDEKSKGTLFLDLLKDDQIDDGTADTEEFAFDTTAQRTNTDRYWFRMKSDQELPGGFKAKLDLDIVSDADYLLEFRDGYTGYDKITEYFEKEFGRDLDEYDDTVRENSLTLDKSWNNYSLTAKALWYDNVAARRQDTDDYTLQTLPSVEFDASKHKLGATGIYYTLDSEFRSFFRQDTTETKVNGQRVDVYPKLYYPTRFAKAFFFEPFVGTRATAWHTDDFTDSYGSEDEFRTRTLYDVGAQLSTKLNRIFTLENQFADKIKHEVVPKLEYAFRPSVLQDDLPYFDSLDRIAEKNIITWSLANTFTSRKIVEGKEGEESYVYKELAWIELSQDYDLKIERDEEDRTHPWSDIYLESELNPLEYLSLDVDLAWDPYNRHFTKTNAGGTLKDSRGDSIQTQYRYTLKNANTWYTRFLVQATSTLGIYYSFEKDLKGKNTIETRTGIFIDQACWGFDLQYREEGGDKKIMFLIILKGIGEFGQK